jgi:Spy/CpxP family protein refolding chaperone
MKPQRKIVSMIVITALFSILVTTLFAQQPGKTGSALNAPREQASPLPPNAPAPPPPPPPPPPAPPSSDITELQGPLLSDLPNLSDEQQEKISQAGINHMKNMTPLHNQIREKRARLQTILTTSPFDAKSADQAADELGKIETGILKELIRHDQELRNLLTPKQQVVFDSRPKPFLRRIK